MALVNLWHFYEPSAVLFQIGSWNVHWYGVLLALGTVSGYLITRVIWHRQGKDINELDELLFGLVFLGLIGARLVDVFFYEWWYFKDHLLEIIFIWQGGLAWHGALLGAGAWLWWRSRSRKYSFFELVDCFAPGLALGQAIGRWGNYFNQELFGMPTSLPWGIPINEANRPAEFAQATHFHPVFLYEFIGLLLIAYSLWHLGSRFKISGRLFGVYLVLTGILRFVLEYLRLDEQNIFWGWRAGFWMAVVSIIFGLYFWQPRSYKFKKDKTVP